MTPDDAIELYAYDRWANGQIFEVAALLQPDQLSKDLGSSYRSVFGTLAHIIWAEWRWLGRWQEQPPAGTSPLEAGDLPRLRIRCDETERGQIRFLATIKEPDLARKVTYENPPGTPWTYSLGQMLHHVVNHSTYHRGQVTTMIRQLGAVPRATDLLVYWDELDSAARRR